MKLGIFGGTFDPIHNGHLAIARAARDQQSLDRILFIPAGAPPHKPDKLITSFAQRLEWIETAIAHEQDMTVSTIEENTPIPSYTVDTLLQLRQQHPNADLFLIVGMDMAIDLPNWKTPHRILELANLIIFPRPESDTQAGIQHLQTLTQNRTTEEIAQSIINIPPIDISSTTIRNAARNRHPINHMVPQEIEESVNRHFS